jgi:Domain of unknown function (DUF4333)
MRRLFVALGAIALVAAFVFAGCGDTLLDATKTEEQLQASLSKSLGEKVSSVDCPSDIEVEKGKTFTCSVNMQKGKDQTVRLEIRNSDADVSVTDIRGSND